jgi:hypothetical protein
MILSQDPNELKLREFVSMISSESQSTKVEILITAVLLSGMPTSVHSDAGEL